jgi:hypothetical protein
MSESELLNPKYNVKSIEKTDPPDGMQGDNWYHYVIGQGNSKIEGFRTGSLKSVTQHVNTYTEELNERIRTGGSTYAQRKTKK